MAYTIQINEEQRLALLELVRITQADQRDLPLECWEGMLEGLPAEEAESPGILHGFCL